MLNSENSSFISFSSPLIENEEIEAVVNVLKSGWLTSGKQVSLFENNFASYKGVEHAIAVNSCTAALHLSLIACNIQPGDEVITTALTFCATVNAIIHVGATPILVDVDLKTGNIDPTQIKNKITKKTKAIIVVHYAGKSCEMNAIVPLCKEHNLFLIEDCAHAIETEYHNQKIGTIGDFGCFSFYVTKNITSAEGGMLLVKNKDHVDRIKKLSLHGMSADAWNRFGGSGFKKYDVEEAGFKYNMTDIQAALGLVQLSKINKFWKHRQSLWNQYTEAFKNTLLTIPQDININETHAYHLYTLLINTNLKVTRDEFIQYLTKNNIGVSVHYTSIPEHTYYQKQYNMNPKDYPNALQISNQTVSLPLSPKLTSNDIHKVIDIVLKAIC